MEHRLERILTICLGGLWLADGIFQLQPAMFTSTFVNAVLTPNLQNQPVILAKIIAFGIHAFAANIFWWNLAAALIQILIGALLLLPLRNNVKRFGLWLSASWAIIIWIFGEGLGNLFAGSATFYTGAPGAALLYLILALFLLYPRKLPLQKLPLFAGMLFLVSAILNLSISGLLGTLLLIGIGMCLILIPVRPVAWITIAFLLVVWWIGQSFGGLLTFPGGTATDFNTAPIFILFLLPIFFTEKISTVLIGK
jgi:hypothetical protein